MWIQGDGPSMTADDGEILDAAMEEASANLLADVVGHPNGEPTLADLERLNPSLTEDEIRDRLHRLCEVSVVRRLEDGEERTYTLTQRARDLFDERGLFPKEAWQRQYQRVVGSDGHDS